MITGYTGSDSDIVIPDFIIFDGAGKQSYAYCMTNDPEGNIYARLAPFAGISAPQEGSGYAVYPVKEVGDQAFAGNTVLRSVIFSNGIAGIGSGAFENCTSLKTIDLPDSLQSIGERAFFNCTALRGTLILPASVNLLGSYAFYKCGFDGDLDLSCALTRIEEYTFFQCDGFVGTLTLPENLSFIGDYAFAGCNRMGGTLEAC